MIPFIKYGKFWIIISTFTIAAALVLVVMWGLKPGIDFTGGSLMEITFSKIRPASGEIQQAMGSVGISNVTVQHADENGIIARSSFLNEDDHQKALAEIRKRFQTDGNEVREDSFQTIGAAVSKQLRSRALWAVILVNAGIIVYIAYAFRRVSRPVASWKYGLLAIWSLIHDVLLVMGVFAVLGKFYGVEVDIAFVVAILTVLGYSVNDTIVVYDRIRENLQTSRNDNFSDTVNMGLNQSLMRSINTTAKTLLPLLALYFLGGTTIHYFALALIIGIASGAYSSIFVAAPWLVLVEKWQRRATA